MIIYPQLNPTRDTQHAIEIDDNDTHFVRDPTGLYALYYGREPMLLLVSTETEGHWDVIDSVRSVHLEKLHNLLGKVVSLNHVGKIIDTTMYRSAITHQLVANIRISFPGKSAEQIFRVEDPSELLFVLGCNSWEEVTNSACRVQGSVASEMRLAHPSKDSWMTIIPT